MLSHPTTESAQVGVCDACQIMKNATFATCDKETSRGIKSAMLSQMEKRQRKHNVITNNQRTLAIWCTKRDKKTLARKKRRPQYFYILQLEPRKDQC